MCWNMYLLPQGILSRWPPQRLGRVCIQSPSPSPVLTNRAWPVLGQDCEDNGNILPSAGAEIKEVSIWTVPGPAWKGTQERVRPSDLFLTQEPDSSTAV